MKKTGIIMAVFAMLMLGSCMSTSFVYTGDYYPPAPDNKNIRVVIDDNRNLAYDEIGVIEVRESFGDFSFAQIVNKACEEARYKGADCIIFLNKSTSVSGSGDAISTSNQYLFKAVKLKGD